MINLDLYRKKDPREIPAYTLPEAASYLRISTSTLRDWITGRTYPTSSGKKHGPPIILVPKNDEREYLLSYYHLVEAYVLKALCHHHGLPLPRVRETLDWIGKKLKVERPLLRENFQTDGMALIVEKFGHLINPSRDGQLEMRQIVEAYFQRIDRDDHDSPIRLYPFLNKVTEAKMIAIDPKRSFGRPILVGTGLATSAIFDRYRGGDSIETLMEDYDINRTQVVSALEYEKCVLAAA